MPRTDRNPKTPDRLDNGSRGNDRHLKFTTPSRWIARFAPLIGRGGPVWTLPAAVEDMRVICLVLATRSGPWIYARPQFGTAWAIVPS